VSTQNEWESDCKEALDAFKKSTLWKGKEYGEIWEETQEQLSEKDLGKKEKVLKAFGMNCLGESDGRMTGPNGETLDSSHN
jgi:hypothetical protein